MVKHIVSWKFKPEVSEEERARVAAEFGERLQAVKEVAKGVLDVKVIAPPLSTSTVDVVLDSTFESEEALAAYQVHPDHVAAGAACVKPYMTDRTCCDFTL
ncbi:MAG: Dabb family protein [Lachnospiraceae bacterium]|nr:Dabb family protein [Lachnospiraceae bacterium]